MVCVSSIRSQSLLMITYLVKLTCKYAYYNKKKYQIQKYDVQAIYLCHRDDIAFF